MNISNKVDISIWPTYLTIIMINIIININIINIILFILVLSIWFRDITRESIIGNHNNKIQISINEGYYIFIITEIMVFVSL
jgi:hypothetical protein